MSYAHGIKISENPTSLVAPILGTAGLQVIFGTAPVNLAADPDNATNKLFLCNTFDEAKAAVGYSDDYDNYTLCQSMDACFKIFNVAPIIICNVLDPATHKASYTETITVVNNQAKSTQLGVLVKDLAVSDGSNTLEPDTDYTLSFDDNGYLNVTLITTGVTSVGLTGYKLDPSAVQATDVIGAYNSTTGKSTGLELVKQVYPLFNMAPGLLLAPGWSHNAAVGIALAAKCEDINGMFNCECIVDISTVTAPKYTDVESVKESNAFNSEHMIACWPMIKVGEKNYYYSAIMGAMIAYTDAENDDVPNLSPSNHLLNATAAIVSTGETVALDLTEANTLNAIGVVTALNLNGIKSWGNNTAGYPDVTTDPKDRWICCRRMFSWWGNSFIMAYIEKVDNPANYRLIESIVDSENIRGNSLVAQGKCAGIKIVYNTEDNPVENVVNGKIVFKQYFAPYTPAEDIENVLEFDVSMIESALGGE